jgi:microcin C transport system permease protein
MVKLSPLASRRWQGFRSNRRGSIACVLFLLLFSVSLLSDILANDRPLVVRTDDGWFFPVVANYAETDFGGDFPTSPDYHDPYFTELVTGKNGWMLWPLIPYRYDTVVKTLDRPAPSPPSRNNWLGTDDQSRDVMARLLYGLRISILFGLALTAVSSVIGIAAGAVQGYFGGLLDLGFQRFIEIWGGLPTLYLLIILSSIVTPNFWWLLGLLSLFSWMGLQGVVRAEVLRTRNFDYVRAARALGAGDGIILRRHILPNAMVATITLMPFLMSSAMTVLTSLDFLGFGLPPGSPSLGELLAQGKNNLQAPWLGITGFVVLSVLLSLLVFTGEAVRDAFDSRRGLR